MFKVLKDSQGQVLASKNDSKESDQLLQGSIERVQNNMKMLQDSKTMIRQLEIL